jgi:hypothetical protein
MTPEFLLVIEDNLVQLRQVAHLPERVADAAEAEARLFSNLAVLVAGGEMEHPEAFCAEIVGRADEIRLETGWDGGTYALTSAENVRAAMGSHRFTYLTLHNGEVLADQGTIQTIRGPVTTGIAGGE